MNEKPKIVLDTNVLLVSISSKSEMHWIFQKLLQEEFELVVSNEILLEYEEVISKKYSDEVADDVIRTLLLLSNVIKSDVYYRWALLVADADDNKFVDCAVSANADYIVTQDKDFKPLETVDFPSVEVLDINGFKELLNL
ncbi:MAG: putative toxin-antitoxin system toxin component, PIN family [Candidatus Aminicenantes bacterium]|nr:putative toxin-antitoxin system toxin component, PIN family [Candidatus Aminicenantes bacterium]